MPKWKPGESGRPPVRRWSEQEIRAFQKDLKNFRERLGYTHRDLEKVLAYSSGGRLAKLYEGYYDTQLHQPSEEFLRRFRALQQASLSPGLPGRRRSSTSPRGEPSLCGASTPSPGNAWSAWASSWRAGGTKRRRGSSRGIPFPGTAGNTGRLAHTAEGGSAGAGICAVPIWWRSFH